MGEDPPGPRRDAGPIGRGWQHVAAGLGALVERADVHQQRRTLTAVPCAVVRKYSDDQGGRLTAQISHAAFLAVFPMLLVLLTVVGIVLDGHPSLQDDIVNSALRQFPVLGPDLRENVHQLSTANTVALVIGLVWLTYGCFKLSRSAQVMMAVVWGVDRDDLPEFWRWIPRAAGFLAVLGIGFVAGGALAGLGAFGRLGGASVVVGLLASLGVNVVMFWGGYRVVISLPRGDRSVWPGAIVAGVGWTLLQFAGALLVSHQLKHLSNLYGTFATVLGLIWWLALGAMITVLAAEFNVVLTRRLWPRSFRRVRHGGDGTPPGSRAGPPSVDPDPAVIGRRDPVSRPG